MIVHRQTPMKTTSQKQQSVVAPPDDIWYHESDPDWQGETLTSKEVHTTADIRILIWKHIRKGGLPLWFVSFMEAFYEKDLSEEEYARLRRFIRAVEARDGYALDSAINDVRQHARLDKLPLTKDVSQIVVRRAGTRKGCR